MQNARGGRKNDSIRTCAQQPKAMPKIAYNRINPSPKNTPYVRLLTSMENLNVELRDGTLFF